MDALATVYEGSERRRKHRRIGFGRRVFRDRRQQERRFDVWNNVVPDEQRENPDRRTAKRRLDQRRRIRDRRVAPVARLELEITTGTPPVF